MLPTIAKHVSHRTPQIDDSGSRYAVPPHGKNIGLDAVNSVSEFDSIFIYLALAYTVLCICVAIHQLTTHFSNTLAYHLYGFL